jgi:hypothetical protein
MEETKMLYTTITIKNRDYKARITAKACVDLEKKLGTNPLNIFIGMAQSDELKLPSLNEILIIIHASLQAYEHKITMDDVYELYDNFIEEGHTYTDLMPIIFDIYKVSGLIPEEVEFEAKNA